MSYPQIIVDSGGGERIKVYRNGVLVNDVARKLNFSTDFTVTDDEPNGEVDVSIAAVGSVTNAENADEIKVYEGGAQVGTLARKLNFDSGDFNVTEDAGNNRFDVEVNYPSTSNFIQKIALSNTNSAINTSSAENTVFTQQVDANLLSTNKGLRFTMFFDLLMNSGTPTLRIRVKYGATTIWDAVTGTMSASAVRRAGWMEVMMVNQDNAAIQALGGFININSGSTTGVTSGIGSIDDGGVDHAGPFGGSATEDSTANKNFVVTIQMSVSNVNVEFRRRAALLELL